jgi:hypothetical protein
MWCLTRIWVVPLNQSDNVFWNTKAMGFLKPSYSSSFLRQTATFLLFRCQHQDASKRGCTIRVFASVTLYLNTFLWLVQSCRSRLGLQQNLRLARFQSFGNRTHSLSFSISAATDWGTLSHALYRLETRADKANLDLQDFMSVRKLDELPCTNSYPYKLLDTSTP